MSHRKTQAQWLQLIYLELQKLNHLLLSFQPPMERCSAEWWAENTKTRKKIKGTHKKCMLKEQHTGECQGVVIG